MLILQQLLLWKHTNMFPAHDKNPSTYSVSLDRLQDHWTMDQHIFSLAQVNNSDAAMARSHPNFSHIFELQHQNIWKIADSSESS